MRRRLFLFLFLVLLPTLAQPAYAGIIFNRKPKKPEPAERVPQLIGILKTERDENKRARAAEELRQFDPTAFPDIVPALVEALQKDTKPSVRAEAARVLGGLRPVSQPAGDALEQAVSGDSSMRVRIQARSALLQYHWAGYRPKSASPGKAPPLNKEPAPAGDNFPPTINTQTGRAPAQPALAPMPTRTNGPRPPASQALTRPVPSTVEPPIAPPVSSPPPAPTPMPPAPTTAPLPTPAPSPTPAPAEGPSLQGPELE
jgi:hypothetical protein